VPRPRICTGALRELWENSGRALGEFWESSGRALGKLWETSGKLPWAGTPDGVSGAKPESLADKNGSILIR